MLNKLICLISLFVFFTKSNAQTTYFDKNGKATDEASAYYVRELVAPPSTYKSRFLTSNTTYFEGIITTASIVDESENIYFGKCLWYYKSGSLKQEINFSAEGKRDGVYKEYYESGKLFKESKYKNGLPESSSYTEYDFDGNAINVFHETFDNNSNDWDLYSSTESISTIENGELRLKALTAKGTSRYIYVESPLSNFTFEANIKLGKYSGNYSTAGFIFGFKDWENYWYFTISGSTYSIGQVVEGIKDIRVNKESCSEIRPLDFNKLKLITNGNRIIFSINGEVQQSINNPKFLGRNLGIIVQGKNYEVSASDIILKEFLGKNFNYSDSNSNVVKSTGTGVFISKEGHIATNYHVVENSSSIEVALSKDGLVTPMKAQVVAIDKLNDLAIIKIDDPSFTPFQEIPYHVKSTNAIEVGATAYTIGYPLALNGMGTEIKFTDGKISAKTGYEGAVNTFQTSIPVQPGNSGGPVFNKNGELIGIINAKVENADNVSYGIKINNLISLAETMDTVIPFERPSDLETKALEEQIKVLSSYVVLLKLK